MKIFDRWRLLTRRSRLTFYGIITLIASVGVAYAAVSTLFTHTFPAITVPGVPALVTTSAFCSGSTLTALTVPSTPSGFEQFGCSPGVTAFTTGTASVTVVASGGMPTGYTDLFAVPTTSMVSGSCGATVGKVALLPSNSAPTTTGLTLTASSGLGLAASTNYMYCADYDNPSTSSLVIATFTVTWQQ